MKIAIVATSHEQLGDSGRKTGLWLEQLAIPYYVFKDAGATITLASPQGGPVPLDPKSESILASNSTIRRFQKDPEAIACLSHSKPLDTLSAGDFDMLYVTGGHGTMWDYPDNAALKELLTAFDQQHKVIGLICHGVAALVSLQNSMGEPFVKGRRLTGFSNSEELVAGLTKVVPFPLESTLVDAGAIYTKAADYNPYTVIDGNLIFGQNAASSLELSRKMLVLFKDMPKPVPNEQY